MFKDNANTMCNNILFTSGTVARMHEQSRRLYEAARELRDAETPSAVARVMGVSPQTVKNWETRGISLEGILAAEATIGCRSAWLRNGEGEMLTSNERKRRGRAAIQIVGTDSPKILHIRSVSLTLRAGFTGTSSDAFEEDGEPFPVSDAWLRKNGYALEDLVAARIRGQSMAPNLNEDDIAVIHLKSKRPIDNKLFAVNYDGEGVIKRLVYDYKRWFLYSDNPDQNRYRPQEASMAPNFIIGQVVTAQKFNL